MDERCVVCGEPRSVHVPTEKGPLTHPREARGEGYYKVNHFTVGGGAWFDDYDCMTVEFIPTASKLHEAETGAKEARP